jgi:antitoxin component YwqK of YwqJK toxin-antitoxin module
MKPINTLVAILFTSLLSAPSWSETLSDLVVRDGLYYNKDSNAPYTGTVVGDKQGSLKNGKKEASWVYRGISQVRLKGRYKNGEKEGVWLYWDKYQVRFRGYYKNGKREGDWVYWNNGRVRLKGRYKNGEQDGAWICYNEDGTVNKVATEDFKDAIKISDLVLSTLTKG